MKLEVGMYARTLDGICEVREVINDGVMSRFVNEYGNVYFGNDMMCNPSFNIIDLIEVGDYVNGSEVTSIEKNRWLAFGNNDWYIPNSGGIKSIVTKEQFESMSYKL